jgi:hypothetical protein
MRVETTSGIDRQDLRQTAMVIRQPEQEHVDRWQAELGWG